MTRKLDAEQAAVRALQAEPGQPGFEAKLAQVLNNATPKPRFYEPPKIESISTGIELDAGIRKYKVTTFAGEYCVAYAPGEPVFVYSCPIKF